MDHRPRYCQAFTETQLARFAPFAARPPGAAAGPEPILYLHADLRIRAGAFGDDPVVFETDDPAWPRFCREALSFPPAWIAELVDPALVPYPTPAQSSPGAEGPTAAPAEPPRRTV